MNIHFVRETKGKEKRRWRKGAKGYFCVLHNPGQTAARQCFGYMGSQWTIVCSMFPYRFLLNVCVFIFVCNSVAFIGNF